MSPTKKDTTRKLIGIRMLPSIIEAMRKQGESEGRSLSNMIERACEQYLKAALEYIERHKK